MNEQNEQNIQNEQIMPVLESDNTVPISPLVVFVATLPDKFNRSSPCLSEVEKLMPEFNLTVLHPYYDFNSEVGKNVLAVIDDQVPQYQDSWENIMRKDLFCVEKSDLVLFDLDAQDINHFLAVAACYNKPIIAVSSSLMSVPVYFSGSVLCIVKPNKIADILRLTLEDDNFLKLPQPTFAQHPDNASSVNKDEVPCEEQAIQ